LLVVLAVVTNHSAANFEPPEWAYPSTPRDFKPDPDDGKPKRLAASTKAYTYAQLQDVFAAPDWYPAEHPKMPDVPVAKGRRPDVRACASCHLTNGLGHPHSGNLAGLQADYMLLQLTDFRTGARHASVGDSPMAAISRALTPEEAKAAVDYFAGLPRAPWVTVIETAMAPKTRIVEGGLRVPIEPEELEPIGQRIVGSAEVSVTVACAGPARTVCRVRADGQSSSRPRVCQQRRRGHEGHDRGRPREDATMHAVPRCEPARDGACAGHRRPCPGARRPIADLHSAPAV
jgi:cytochrome c553